MQKIQFLYENNLNYKQKIQEIIDDAEENIVLPPIGVINNRNTNENKRHLSGIEIANKKYKQLEAKFNPTMIGLIKTKLNVNKLRAVPLKQLMTKIINKNPNLKLGIKNPKKEEILEWFEKNFDAIFQIMQKMN